MKKAKRKYPDLTAARELEKRVASLPRTVAPSARTSAMHTVVSGIRRTSAVWTDSGSAEPMRDERDWDGEHESRDVMRENLFRALLDRDAASISEDLAARFEQCRERMRDKIDASRHTFLIAGATILVAVVVAVLTIVLTLVTPRLDGLEDESDSLRESVVRIETKLESFSAPPRPVSPTAIPEQSQGGDSGDNSL